jgi:hypothetical protein
MAPLAPIVRRGLAIWAPEGQNVVCFENHPKCLCDIYKGHRNVNFPKYDVHKYCRLDRNGTDAWRPRGARARVFVNFRKFSKTKIMHRARAARPPGFNNLPSMDPNRGRCPLAFSAGSSKIKIRTSSRHNAKFALCLDEVRILIFDDPAKNERGERPRLQFRSA